MKKFKKKPVVIEAVQLQVGEKSMAEIQVFTGGLARPADGGAMTIPTLEGVHRADIGDWIIKGVKNEFYPCKPDIFAATYDPADKSNGCHVCSSTLVEARGKHPGDVPRMVCPTCMADKMDMVKELADRDYGRAFQSCSSGLCKPSTSAR